MSCEEPDQLLRLYYVSYRAMVEIDRKTRDFRRNFTADAFTFVDTRKNRTVIPTQNAVFENIFK